MGFSIFHTYVSVHVTLNALKRVYCLLAFLGSYTQSVLIILCEIAENLVVELQVQERVGELETSTVFNCGERKLTLANRDLT